MEFKLLSDDHIQFIDETVQKVRLRISIDEASESIKVKLQPYSKVLWSGKFLARPKITKEKVVQLRTYFQVPSHLELEPKLLDQSRVHPRYAKYFNHRYHLFHTLLFNDDVPSHDVQRSYGDSLSFIGNAILQFVATLMVFYENGENISNGMMERNVRHMVDSTYLANLCQYSEWDSMLAYNSKKLSLECKKGEKIYSDQLKGWLGALYASNSIENLPDVLEVAKKMLSLEETELTFESLVKKEYDRTSAILGGCIGFGMGVFITTTIWCWLCYATL